MEKQLNQIKSGDKYQDYGDGGLRVTNVALSLDPADPQKMMTRKRIPDQQFLTFYSTSMGVPIFFYTPTMIRNF